MKDTVLKSMSRKALEKIEHKEKIVEKRDKMLRHDFSSERAIFEEVFDRSTLMVIFKFLNKDVIDEIHGVVSAGKESRVYWGKNKKGEELAIKIYLTVSAAFRKGMLKYIQGDHRFKSIKHNTRALISTWAMKEFRNLEQATRAKVRVPKPVIVKKNVLVMEFIGENGISAPTLKAQSPKNPKQIYNTILSDLKRLYQKAELVHGDLSEYNVMVFNERPVLFDMSQSVPISHPLASSLLNRDLTNLNRFFAKLGVKVSPIEESYQKVVE